jgi:hypothetical protein
LTAAHAMRPLLLPRIADVSRERIVEGLAIDILSVRRKVRPHGSRQVTVGKIGHALKVPGSYWSAAATFGGRRPETQPFLIAIFFSLFCACGVFGSVTESTPFLKLASIFSASTPSGTPNERWNEP